MGHGAGCGGDGAWFTNSEEEGGEEGGGGRGVRILINDIVYSFYTALLLPLSLSVCVQNSKSWKSYRESGLLCNQDYFGVSGNRNDF